MATKRHRVGKGKRGDDHMKRHRVGSGKRYAGTALTKRQWEAMARESDRVLRQVKTEGGAKRRESLGARFLRLEKLLGVPGSVSREILAHAQRTG
jgi:hypothetical protein